MLPSWKARAEDETAGFEVKPTLQLMTNFLSCAERSVSDGGNGGGGQQYGARLLGQ